MATKKKARYLTPIGTFNYPWLDQPSKWSNSARDGQGGSVPAERTDVNARYSVKVTFTQDEFDKSDFKKQIDDVWAWHKKNTKADSKLLSHPIGRMRMITMLSRQDATPHSKRMARQ